MRVLFNLYKNNLKIIYDLYFMAKVNNINKKLIFMTNHFIIFMR